jgi:trehalose 6-phosphate synthase
VIGSLAGRALIIGADRLDYSKGIPQRLSAFELFLQTQPNWRGKVTYLQIAPKSRTEIPSRRLDRLRDALMAPLVRRTGRRSVTSTVPIVTPRLPGSIAPPVLGS